MTAFNSIRFIWINVNIALLIMLALHARGQIQFTNQNAFKSQQSYLSIPTWGTGVSFFDVNEDGWDDITLCADTSDYLSILFGSAEGQIELVTDIFIEGHAKHPMWMDFDNDGDNDLLLSFIDSSVVVFRHDSLGHFTNVSNSTGLLLSHDQYYGLGAGDVDNNGYLDLYVCNYGMTHTNAFFLFDSTNFQEIALNAGIEDSTKTSFSVMIVDFDHDGLMDIYVVNDHSFGNQLYINNGDSTFDAVSSTLNISLNGMGIAHNDFNEDGYMDLFITNTQLNRYLVSNSTGAYTEVANALSIDSAHTSWGCLLFDPDLDRDRDLFVASGETYSNIPYHKNFFYENIENTAFLKDSMILHEAPLPTYASAFGDYNADGLPDVVYQNSSPGKAELWKNTTVTNNHWLRLLLQGSISNRNAFGASIIAYQGAQAYHYWNLSSESYLGQNSQFLNLSSGDTCGFDSIYVNWPMIGSDTMLYSVHCDQNIRLVEGGLAYPVPTIQLPKGRFICSGDPVEITVSGHYSSLQWSTGSTSDTITVALGGSYDVTVTNQFGQSASTASVQIGSVQKPKFEIEIKTATCFGDHNGRLQAILNSGQSQVSYEWNTGATAAEIKNLDTGLYTVRVINQYGCTRTKSIQLTQPDSLIINELRTDLLCFEDASGSIVLSPSGGTAPYSFVWSDNAFTSSRLNLAASDYSVTVSDVRACKAYGFYELGEPPELLSELIVDQPDTSIAEWNIQLLPQGGTPPYSYTWSHSALSTFDTAIIRVPGTYQATVIDSVGCSFLIDFELNDSTSNVLDLSNLLHGQNWYPNPSNGPLISKGGNVPLVEIYSLYGQKIAALENVNELLLPRTRAIQCVMVKSYFENEVQVQRIVIQ